MKLTSILFVIMAAVYLTGCTMIPDATTRAYVYDRVKSIQSGNTTDQVMYLLDGPPTNVTTLQKNSDRFELWEYKVGNFIYSQSPMIFFKNGRVIGVPQNGYELTQILNHYQIIEGAQFWNNQNK